MSNFDWSLVAVVLIALSLFDLTKTIVTAAVAWVMLGTQWRLAFVAESHCPFCKMHLLGGAILDAHKINCPIRTNNAAAACGRQFGESIKWVCARPVGHNGVCCSMADPKWPPPP
jgi:hypothetical protein